MKKCSAARSFTNCSSDFDRGNGGACAPPIARGHATRGGAEGTEGPQKARAIAASMPSIKGPVLWLVGFKKTSAVVIVLTVTTAHRKGVVPAY